MEMARQSPIQLFSHYGYTTTAIAKVIQTDWYYLVYPGWFERTQNKMGEEDNTDVYPLHEHSTVITNGSHSECLF